MAQVVEPQENEQKNEDAEEEMQEEVPEVPDVRYLDCSALAKWITESGDNANKTFLVVDVRDDGQNYLFILYFDCFDQIY